MKFTLPTILITFLAPLALAGEAATLSFDPVYSTPSTSTLNLACSDGANGLYTKGFPTLGSLSKYPNVVASPEIQGMLYISIPNFIINSADEKYVGWNSAQCGACYKLYYKGTGKSVYAVGVDVGRGGFVGSQQVLDTLTNGRATAVGRVDVSWLRVEPVLCGFK